MDLLVNTVVMCQKVWRMKKFRECLMGLRKDEITNRISMFSRDITLDLERQRAKEEHEAKRVHYAVVCQRAVRRKRLRACLAQIRARLDRERLERLTRAAVMCQRQWRMTAFRRKLNEIKLKELEHKAALAKYAIVCQRAIRMKLFRKCLTKLVEARETEKREKEYQEKLLSATIKCQRWRRMIVFRRCLIRLRLQRQKELDEFNKLVACTILCQRAARMKIFRSRLEKLRQERLNLIQQVVLVQKAFRMKRFRRCLAVLVEERRVEIENRAAVIIQHQWRLFKFRRQMRLYRASALRIQSWFLCDMNERVRYLKLRRSTIAIQKIYKAVHAKRVQAALVLQKNWRMRAQVQQYQKEMSAIVLIQKWFRSKRDRLRYVRLKRSLPLVQLQCKAYLARRNESASIIQKQYRMYKFRREMSKYRRAAVCIQRWTRSMSERYLFLKKVRIIFQIQALYRRIYMPRRESAALTIQCAWRSLISRRLLEQMRRDFELKLQLEREQARLNVCATRIQALWRGHQARKETNPILNTIRSRLSIYGLKSNGNEHTLGSRIRNSLKILKYPNVEIQQLIFALTDMDKVTRLSPECCQIFIKEGALNILYAFIENCNRSVPHMDLIKYCLQVFINLAKYPTTASRVLEPANSIPILIKLLDTNSSINPTIYQFNIFMNVCILFIILSQYELIVRFVIAHEQSFVKKLQHMYPVLERRTHLKLKKQQEKQAAATISSSKDQLMNSSYIPATPGNLETKKGCSATFTFEPEWSLTKKASVEFTELFGAMEHLLSAYEIKINVEPALATPMRNSSVGSISELSSKKSRKEECGMGTPTRNSSLGSISELSSNKKGRKDELDGEKSENGEKVESKVSRNLSMKYQSQIKSISSLKTAGQNGRPFLIKQSNTRSMRKAHMEAQSSSEMEQLDYDDHISICSNESYRSTASNTTIRSVASFHSERPRMNSTSIIPSRTAMPIIKRANTDTGGQSSARKTSNAKQ